MVKTDKKYQHFKSKTIAQIDAEVDEEYAEDRRRRTIKSVILVIIIFLMMPDAFLYWFRFATPHFAKHKTTEAINVVDPPVQTALDPYDTNRFIMYNTLENRGTYKLEKLADYSISGVVLATNYYFWGNYLPGGDRPLQSIMLFDVGIGWDKLTDKDILKNYRFYSTKDYTSRSLTAHLRHGVQNPPMTIEETGNFYSHTNVIPANPTIMHALIFARRYQPIKMDGYLVHMYINGREVSSSLSRTDDENEIMYVNKIQIGKKIYE